MTDLDKLNESPIQGDRKAANPPALKRGMA
jgi:hypothetical protein